MEEVYAQARRTAPLTVRVLVLLLTAELTGALLLSDGAVASQRLMLRSVVVLVCAVLLLPFPGRGGWSGVALVAWWSALGAVALLSGTALAGGVELVARREVWLVAVGLALLIALFSSIACALAHWLSDRRAAAHGVLGLLLLSLTLPLWLSPMVGLFGATRWLVDTVISLCPLTYLATLADIDYLRSDWFYQHTPYGGLRYDYPDPAYLSMAILLLLAAMLALAWRRVPAYTLSDQSQSPEFCP